MNEAAIKGIGSSSDYESRPTKPAAWTAAGRQLREGLAVVRLNSFHRARHYIAHGPRTVIRAAKSATFLIVRPSIARVYASRGGLPERRNTTAAHRRMGRRFRLNVPAP